MTFSITWTPTQWSSYFGGIFLDAGLSGGLFFAAAADGGGVIFDATTSQQLQVATINGAQRVMDPPILVDWVFHFSVGRVVFGSGVAVCSFEIGYVPEAAPANYSQTLFPWGRNETSLGVFNLGVVPELPAVLSTSITVTSTQMATLRAQSTSRAAWSGRFAMSIRQISGAATEIQAPTLHTVDLVTNQQIFFGGLTGGGSGKLRAVRDGRYAMPAWNTELVRDGDNPGLWVRPWDSDPEDESATYKRKPGEGTVTDEIPDV